MTTESAILDIVKKLPEPIKQAVLLYTEFLASRYAKDTPAESEQPPSFVGTCLAGALKGTFVLPLSDDFDQPLEEFEEYM